MKNKLLMICICSLILFVSCGNQEITKEQDEPESNVKIGSVGFKRNPSVTKGKVRDQKMIVDEVTIGHFETPLLDKSESRLHNINLAAKKLHQYTLNPGDEFSFNQVVGKRTPEKGYKEAPIIIVESGSPENSDALGGGICQISSTLYNAVLNANLKVTERHPHSKKVSYIEEGMDATIDFDRYDLKFINTGEYPITLKVLVKEDIVSIDIIEKRTKER